MSGFEKARIINLITGEDTIKDADELDINYRDKDRYKIVCPKCEILCTLCIRRPKYRNYFKSIEGVHKCYGGKKKPSKKKTVINDGYTFNTNKIIPLNDGPVEGNGNSEGSEPKGKGKNPVEPDIEPEIVHTRYDLDNLNAIFNKAYDNPSPIKNTGTNQSFHQMIFDNYMAKEILKNQPDKFLACMPLKKDAPNVYGIDYDNESEIILRDVWSNRRSEMVHIRLTCYNPKLLEELRKSLLTEDTKYHTLLVLGEFIKEERSDDLLLYKTVINKKQYKLMPEKEWDNLDWVQKIKKVGKYKNR